MINKLKQLRRIPRNLNLKKQIKLWQISQNIPYILWNKLKHNEMAQNIKYWTSWSWSSAGSFLFDTCSDVLHKPQSHLVDFSACIQFRMIFARCCELRWICLCYKFERLPGCTLNPLDFPFAWLIHNSFLRLGKLMPANERSLSKNQAGSQAVGEARPRWAEPDFQISSSAAQCGSSHQTATFKHFLSKHPQI